MNSPKAHSGLHRDAVVAGLRGKRSRPRRFEANDNQMPAAPLSVEDGPRSAQDDDAAGFCERRRPGVIASAPADSVCGERFGPSTRHRCFLVAAALVLCFYPTTATARPAREAVFVGLLPSHSASHTYPSRKRGAMSSTSRSRPPSASRTSQRIDTWSQPVVRSQQPGQPMQGTGADRKNESGVSTSLNGSRFGVRRRVRRVLDKARKRTGIENGSTTRTSSPGGLVDSDASGGGNGGSSDFLQRASTYNGVSRNGAAIRTGANVVAETASIGGLGAVVVDDEGRIDVALDYISSSKKETVQPKVNMVNEPKFEDAAALTKIVNDVRGASKIARNESYAHAADPLPSDEDESPEDDLVLASSKGTSDRSRSTPDKRRSRSINGDKVSFPEKDAFTSDVSAAFSLPPQPLPFTLPTLTTEQHRRLVSGERVQYQDDMGLAGSGFVVCDVKAPASVVWDCLLDFNSYPQTIPTVREVVMYTNTHLTQDYRAEKPVDFEDGTVAICQHGVPSVTRAQFSLSKFRLKIAALHKYRPHPEGDYMVFTLDPASSNMVLKFAKGVWHTQSNPDGKEGYTRVWLLCELRVSRLLPQWIVDYAAARAMPRATAWLKPQVEAAATLWLKDRAGGGMRQ